MTQSADNAQALIDGLIQKTAPIELERYKLYLQFHVKQLLTHLSKYRIEQDTKPKIHYYNCKLKCYNRFSQPPFNIDKKQYLSTCVEQCKQPIKNLQEYLDDINYLSSKKLRECTNKCDKAPAGMDGDCYRNLCMWECYNKLDRRYMKYWFEKRNDVLKKHNINVEQ